MKAAHPRLRYDELTIKVDGAVAAEQQRIAAAGLGECPWVKKSQTDIL